MTQNSTERLKVILPVSIAAILLVAVAGFNLFDSNAQAEVHFTPGEPTTETCVQVQHWDKIIFKSKKDILNADGLVVVDKNAIMDIKVLDDPNLIEFPMQKAADRLNLPGWTTDKGDPFTPDDLKLIDIEYAIICLTFVGEEGFLVT